ncbi:MAG: hypothetical protein NT027_10045 [Proteobacteria bacterium]|nr:hypothetical protein [Pseudomonadota bacterium]
MVASFLKSILKGTAWSELSTFISPAFFSVVPTLEMMREAGNLAKSGFNKTQIETTNSEAHKLVIASLSQDEMQNKQILALGYYFAQIMHLNHAIVDLRSDAFKLNDGSEQKEITWSPAPLIVHWDSEFLSGIRDLYKGFYLEDAKLFSDSLKTLKLSPAEPELRRHFGEGDQSNVRFSLIDFQKSFQNVFLACQKNKLSLHPQFFGLGAMLVSLYENLERAETGLNVRDVFIRVSQVKL